jgi:hypothetical protein
MQCYKREAASQQQNKRSPPPPSLTDSGSIYYCSMYISYQARLTMHAGIHSCVMRAHCMPHCALHQQAIIGCSNSSARPPISLPIDQTSPDHSFQIPIACTSQSQEWYSLQNVHLKKLARPLMHLVQTS